MQKMLWSEHYKNTCSRHGWEQTRLQQLADNNVWSFEISEIVFGKA